MNELILQAKLKANKEYFAKLMLKYFDFIRNLALLILIMFALSFFFNLLPAGTVFGTLCLAGVFSVITLIEDRPWEYIN